MEELPKVFYLNAASGNNHYPICIDNLLLITSECGADYCLLALSPDKKNRVWTFKDKGGLFERQYTNINFYNFERYTVLPLVNQILVIDHYSGEHLDTILFQGNVASNLFGSGRYVFPIVTNRNISNLSILSHDLIEGRTDTIISIPFQEDEVIISVGPISCPVDSTAFYNSVLEYRPSDNMTYNYLIKWNRDKGITDSISLTETNFMGFGVTRPPLIDSINGISFWHLTNSIVAYNHNTNTVAWTKTIGKVSLVSRPVLFFDKIIYPTEANFFLVINKHSGYIVDTIPNTPSFPGRIISNRDKLFFIGGIDGNIYTLNKSHEVSDKSTIYLSMIYEGSLHHQLFINNEQFVIHNGKQWIFSEFKSIHELNLIYSKPSI